MAALNDDTGSRCLSGKWPVILKDALAASAGVASPTVLFLSYLALNGALEWFWLFYIRVNIEHVSLPFSEYLSTLPSRMVLFAERNLFWLPVSTVLAFAAAEMASRINRQKPPVHQKYLAVLLLAFFALTAVYATTRTLSLFDHYIN